VRQPTLLLCDEPTGNLDKQNADAVSDMLVALQKTQPTVLIVVTHSADLARRFEKRFILVDGRLAPDANLSRT
jgi:lipoprotein-releasing system ATP-binding protein